MAMTADTTTTTTPDIRDLVLKVLQAEIDDLLPKIGMTTISRRLWALAKQGQIPESCIRVGHLAVDLDYEIFHALNSGAVKATVTETDGN
jgi:hypothetical protein